MNKIVKIIYGLVFWQFLLIFNDKIYRGRFKIEWIEPTNLVENFKAMDNNVKTSI